MFGIPGLQFLCCVLLLWLPVGHFHIRKEGGKKEGGKEETLT